MSNYSENTPDIKAKNTSWTKIINFIPEGSLVLDVGCSSGALGEELKRAKQCVVYGTEVDPGDYQKASKVLDRAFLFNIELDPLPKDIAGTKFDTIIFADVLEHLVDPVASLSKIHKLLAKGGRVIFSIPNMAHISVRFQLLNGHFDYNETGLLDKTHLHFYDQEEVQRIFSAAGYQIDVLDANILTYPKSFIRKKLAALELGDKGFIEKISKDKRAQTFQFVGYATLPAAAKSLKPARLGTSTPERELTEYIEALNDNVAKLDMMLKDKHRELEQMVADMQALRSSTTWRVGRMIVGPAGRVLRRDKQSKTNSGSSEK